MFTAFILPLNEVLLSHESVPMVVLPESVKIDGFLKTKKFIPLEASQIGQNFLLNVELSNLKYDIRNTYPVDSGHHEGQCKGYFVGN